LREFAQIGAAVIGAVFVVMALLEKNKESRIEKLVIATFCVASAKLF